MNKKITKIYVNYRTIFDIDYFKLLVKVRKATFCNRKELNIELDLSVAKILLPTN